MSQTPHAGAAAASRRTRTSSCVIVRCELPLQQLQQHLQASQPNSLFLSDPPPSIWLFGDLRRPALAQSRLYRLSSAGLGKRAGYRVMTTCCLSCSLSRSGAKVPLFTSTLGQLCFPGNDNDVKPHWRYAFRGSSERDSMPDSMSFPDFPWRRKGSPMAKAPELNLTWGPLEMGRPTTAWGGEPAYLAFVRERAQCSRGRWRRESTM